MATVRERCTKDGTNLTDEQGQVIWEVRVYIGRHAVTNKPS